MFFAVKCLSVGTHSAKVTLAATTIFDGITVQNFLPVSTSANPQSIVHSGQRGEVEHSYDLTSLDFVFTDEADYALFPVFGVHPFEATFVEVQLVERFFSLVDPVEVFYPLLN